MTKPDLTPKMRRVLEVLQTSASRGHSSQTPNDIASQMGDLKPKPKLSHNGKQMGGGSLITFTIQALERRGYVGWGSRPDGLSGTAYFITQAGRQALMHA